MTREARGGEHSAPSDTQTRATIDLDASLRKERPRSSVVPLDHAEAPSHPIGPNRQGWIVAARICGLVLGSPVALGRAGLAQARERGASEKLDEIRATPFTPSWRRVPE